jgi:hypothetical protein
LYILRFKHLCNTPNFESETRPGYPLNLSILLSGGK